MGHAFVVGSGVEHGGHACKGGGGGYTGVWGVYRGLGYTGVTGGVVAADWPAGH